MISRMGPRFRMYLRVLAFGGLLGCIEAVVEMVVRGTSPAEGFGLDQTAMGIIQSYALGNIFVFGITYGIIALIVTKMFDYEPSPRRFKRVMALTLLPFALLLTGASIYDALQYPSLYDALHAINWIAHVVGVLLLSQYIARHYLRELANSNQEQKPA